MSTSHSKVKNEIPSENKKEAPTAVDNLPFSYLSKLYADLRNMRPGGPKRQRPLSARQQNESRHTILTRFWLQICQKALVDDTHNILSSREVDRQIIPAQILSPPESFKLISLIIPELDTAHAYMGMKESKLAESFIRALDLPPSSEDAQWLKHYKERAYRPRKWRQDPLIVDGSLPSVLNAVLKDRCPVKSSLTIGTVWTVLDMLTQSNRVRNRRFVKPSANEDSKSADTQSDASHFQDARKRSVARMEETKYNALTTLIRHGTAEEVSEVSRVILKDMNMRLSQDNFLSWFHPSAKQHFTQIHDVHRMLSDCHNTTFEIGDAAVQLGQYASVMLTMRPSRRNLAAICENLRGGVQSPKGNDGAAIQFAANNVDHRPYFIMEPKLDGERLQLHKWKSKNQSADQKHNIEVRTFTRRGNDSSGMYSDALFEVIKQGVRALDIILDGEIMIWDDLRGKWLRFEDMREVTTAIARHTVPEGSSYTLKYMVFDVLYVDQGASSKRLDDGRKAGNMVMRLPLHKRRTLLEKLVRKTELNYGVGAKAVVEVVGMERGYAEPELTNTLQRYETLGYEGVIAKNPDMPYVLAERRLDIAIKLKPDYFDGGIQDLDVLILGAKYSGSSGHRVKRAGRLSSFLIGVRASDSEGWQEVQRGMESEEAMKRCKWVVVGSVGSGYSDKELEELQEHCKLEWKDFDSKNLPDHFDDQDYASTVLSGVAKWIQPWKSIVLTVRAYEVNRRFNLLRFPRVERINWEKPYYDVTTFSHLLDLDENKVPAFIKGDERDGDEVADKLPASRKRKGGFDSDEELALQLAKEEGHVIRGGRNARSVIASALGADVSQVERICEVFKGITFHVLGMEVETKEHTEVMIHQLGGTFVQNVTEKVDFIICSNAQMVNVRRLKEKIERGGDGCGQHSILLSSWVSDCYEKREKCRATKVQIVYANAALEAELYKECDRFGDSWTRSGDMKSFQCSIQEVCQWKTEPDVRNQESAENKVLQDVRSRVKKCFESTGGVFQDVKVMAAPTIGGVALHGSVELMRAFGAEMLDHRDCNEVVHVLVHSSVSESPEMQAWLNHRNHPNNFRIVTERWVLNKIQHVAHVPPPSVSNPLVSTAHAEQSGQSIQ